MMGSIRRFLRRSAALFLAASLLCAAALAAEPEKTTAERRREDLEFLYQTVLVENHPAVFTNAPEPAFAALRKEIEARLETESDVEFLLDLMRLTALVGDAHTMISIGGAADFRCYPFSLILRDGKWYLSMLPAAERASLGKRVTAVNGRSMEKVVETFAQLLPADNPVILTRRFRQDCQIADMYEYLGLAKAGESLTLTLEGGRTLVLEPMPCAALQEAEPAYLSDRIVKTPATAAADAYYFAKPLNRSTYYIQYNICREAEDLSMEDFATLVQADLDAGRYDRVLLDLRNNGGGSDGVLWPLLTVLRRSMDRGCELVGLIGPATFSSALINAVEIQEMGGVLAGESAGGSVSHFGSVRSFSLPNSGVRGQLSGKYIDLNTLLDAGAGRGVAALEPDVSVPQTLTDTLAGRDTVVEWLLSHPEKLEQKAHPDAPLTRGRFIGRLYEVFGSPDGAPDDLPFADSLGVEWYLPALAWAKEAGIARGAVNSVFSAARPVTWQEAAVFLTRAAGETAPSAQEINRRGPLPAALAEGGSREAVARAWDLGLLPEQADFTRAPTRAQGLEMAGALSELLK